MTAQEYITEALARSTAPVERIDIGSTPLEDAILAKVMSKKFRKLRADEAAIETAKQAIHLAVSENKPIRLMLFFGGNKLWRLDEAPHIEWGELFSFLYYIEWAKSIASVYEPGALIEYFSMDSCIERMNNVPHEETDLYSEDFYQLLDWAKPYIPKGVSTKYTRYADLFDSRQEMDAQWNESMQRMLAENNGQPPELNEAQRIAVELNVKLKPGQDSDPLWRERVELHHSGLFGATKARAYMRDPSLIPHCPTWYSRFVATGSTKRSLAKFWVGVGALEHAKDGGYNEIILTPKQLETAQFDWEPVHFDGLDGKNFSRIRVLK